MSIPQFFVRFTIGVFAALVFSAAACSQAPPLPSVLNLKTVAVLPHNRDAYTQGLVFRDGVLFESTGEYGSSSLRKVEPATGEVLMKMSLPPKYFAEGIEIVGDKIFQLTWREGYCFVFDRESFRLLDQFRYSGEGWGLAYDGRHLIMSDGSATLRFLDPENFKQKRKIQVSDRDPKTKRKIPVTNLNELEFIRGEIWANVWQTAHIVRIDPKSGDLIGRIDCSGFVPGEYKAEHSGRALERNHVLNGIAFDPVRNRVYLTGKNWPVLYELEIVDP